MITKYIEGTSNNKAIEITNLTGHDVDLSNYFLRIQLKGTSYYFSDAYELEGKLNSGQSIVIINPYATLSNYSISQANFITNSPPLTYTGSQYVELAYGKKYLKTVSTNNYDMDLKR
jgi:predicted extracellular nuclease